MATPAQIDHITQHLDDFHAHAGTDRTVEDYFADHEDKYPDLYERLCHDLRLTPIQEAPMTQTPDIQTLIQNEVQRVMAELGPETVQTLASPENHYAFLGNTLEEVLGGVDPRDSDAALAMLDFLLRTQRLHRVGVLDGGQGYLFMYQEPQGSTKQGYRPGATQGDRIVDEAVEAQRAAGSTPAKRGMCPHCFSVVAEVEDKIVLDDETRNPVCPNSPDGTHDMA